MPAQVVSLYQTNASDIPAMLRGAADRIESGESPVKSMVAVTVDTDGEINLYGWGQTDSVDTLANLQLAITQHSIAMLSER